MDIKNNQADSVKYSSLEYEYQIFMQEELTESGSIVFPTLIMERDMEKQKMINDLINSYKFGKNQFDSNVTYDIECQVMCYGKYLSLCFSGYYCDNDSLYVSDICYGINIDLNDARIMKLSEYCDNEIIKNKIRDEDYKPIRGIFFEIKNNAEIKKKYNLEELFAYDNALNNESIDSFYIIENGIGLIFNSFSQYEGGYSVIEIGL